MSAISNINRTIILFIFSMLIASAVVFQSATYWSEKNNELQLARKNLLIAKTEYEKAEDNRKILKDFNDKFTLINKLGIINSENRLDWAERIESIANSFNIPLIDYTITQQVELKDAQLKIMYPGISINKSSMKITMQMLHEGDFFRFFYALDTEAKGLFDIEQCNIERAKQLGTNLLEQKSLKNLTSSCVLNWYSIKTKGA